MAPAQEMATEVNSPFELEIMKDPYAQISADLAVVRSAKTRPGMFGEEAHEYRVNAPLSEKEISSFEKLHDISLPDEYRSFLLKVGNGGAGPSYGLFRLGEMDSSFTVEPWTSDIVGKLSNPWPHRAEWNDLTGQPDDDCEDENLIEAFESNYWGPGNVPGAFPICHNGCALRELLVIRGPERGNVWYDARADYAGLRPLEDSHGNRLNFLNWYRQWLDEALSKLAPLIGT
jgi:hypothetical protein